MVAAGAAPRINPRTGRGVAALSPDHAARSGPAPFGEYVVPTPALVPTLPGLVVPPRRIGPVGKLAGGHLGHGHRPPLGMVPLAAGQMPPGATGEYPVLENAPATIANYRLPIPRKTPVGSGVAISGRQLRPTYAAHDFAPATRFFNQARSSRPWAQAEYPPVPGGRPLIPSVQPQTLARMTLLRRQIPAGQINAGLYTIGYPTRASVAALLGAGGPVAVLGGMTGGYG